MGFPPATAGASGYRRIAPTIPRLALPYVGWPTVRLISARQPTGRQFLAQGPPDPIPYTVYDDFESYTDGANLLGLNGGWYWKTAYFLVPSFQGLEDFESYTDGANLSGLNGGTGWTGAYAVT